MNLLKRVKSFLASAFEEVALDLGTQTIPEDVKKIMEAKGYKFEAENVPMSLATQAVGNVIRAYKDGKMILGSTDPEGWDKYRRELDAEKKKLSFTPK